MERGAAGESWPRGWQPIPYADRCRARESELARELERFVAFCRAQADIAYVVVFGSYARDDVSPWSDLDVMVVRDAPHDARSIDLVGDLYAAGVAPGDVIGVPTSRYPQGLEATPFGRTILAEGRVVYARPT